MLILFIYPSVACYFCEDEAGCEDEPELGDNGRLVEDSPYSEIGCTNGCWVRKTHFIKIIPFLYLVSGMSMLINYWYFLFRYLVKLQSQVCSIKIIKLNSELFQTFFQTSTYDDGNAGNKDYRRGCMENTTAEAQSCSEHTFSVCETAGENAGDTLQITVRITMKHGS